MDWNNSGSPVGVLQKHMAATLTDDAEPCPLQGTHDLGAGNGREAAHTAMR